MKIIDGKEHIPQVRELIAEYTSRLNMDLSFQNLDEELLNPAEKYTPPQGEVLIAIEDNTACGMVAYHRHSGTRCEMKRLYVKPDARGLHLGDSLVERIIECARSAGYKEMVLDTLSHMQAAIHLYKKHGFEECEPYYMNPTPDVIYMIKSL